MALSNGMPRARNSSCEPSTFLIGSGFDEIDDSYELDFVAAVSTTSLFLLAKIYFI